MHSSKSSNAQIRSLIATLIGKKRKNPGFLPEKATKSDSMPVENFCQMFFANIVYIIVASTAQNVLTRAL